MRKPKYEFGNVGSNSLGDKRDRKRCNCCNFLNGTDGHRVMHKDEYDKYGGYICSECKKFPLGHEKGSWKEEDWYQEAIYNSKQTVDGERDYDEMIEDLITEWEKSQDR